MTLTHVLLEVLMCSVYLETPSVPCLPLESLLAPSSGVFSLLIYHIFNASPLYHRDMGCRLPKLRKAEERQSPGNIYSTLRRPQVETKVGVAYTYHFLDFLLGKEGMDKIANVLSTMSVKTAICEHLLLYISTWWSLGWACETH